MRRTTLFVTLLVAALALAPGCKKAQVQTTPAPEPASAAASAPTTTPTPETPTEVTEGFKTETPAPPVSVEASIEELNASGVLKTVYFDYDSSDLLPDARTTLQGNADWLKRNAARRVEIGGHCDERGSIEYNLALGDRRANQVRDYLVNLGVDGSRLEAVSYGEEKPAGRGHGEDAWAKNRRAEFRIKS